MSYDNYATYLAYKNSVSSLANDFVCVSGDNMAGSLNMHNNDIHNVKNLTIYDGGKIILRDGIEVDSELLNNVKGIHFTDGTYLGEGNSFDISTNQLLHFKTTDRMLVEGNTSFKDNVVIEGKLITKGATTQVNTEDLVIKDNLIIINQTLDENRKTDPTGVLGNPFDFQSGFVVYRGPDASGNPVRDPYQFLYDEVTNTFRVGTLNEMQPVATREDEPIHNAVAVWDSSLNKFVTNPNFVLDASGNNVTEGLTVLGDAKMNNVRVRNLDVSENLVVSGETTLLKADISENLLVKGDTFVNDVKAVNVDISENLVVKGDTVLENVGLKNVDISENLVVKGDTVLEDVGLKNVDISENLVVKGDTVVNDVGARNVDISENLVVKGDTVLENVGLKNVDISENMVVKGDTVLENVGLNNVDISENMVVKGDTVVNDVGARNVDISENLVVKGDTVLENVGLKNVDISQNMVVNGDTVLENVGARNVDISENLVVKGDTVLENVGLNNVDISENLLVKGDTVVNDVKAVNVDLSGDLIVKGDTVINDVSAVNIDVSGDVLVEGELNVKKKVSMESYLELNCNIIRDVSNIEFCNSRNYLQDIETIDISINTLQNRADVKDMSVNILEGRTDSLDVSVNVLEGRADGLDVSVNVLEGRADGFDASLNSLDVSVNILEGRADGFDVSLNSLDDLKFDKVGGLISGSVQIDGNLGLQCNDISNVNRVIFCDDSSIGVGNSLDISSNGVLTLRSNESVLIKSSAVVKQNLDILGNLNVKGTTTQVSSEDLVIKDNLIVINQTMDASGNVDLSGVVFEPNSFESGFVVFRGTDPNSGDPTVVRTPYQFLYSEETNTFNVGISGEMQPVATREFNPSTDGVAVWNSTEFKFDTVRGVTVDTSGNMSVQGTVDIEKTLTAKSSLAMNDTEITQVSNIQFSDATNYLDTRTAIDTSLNVLEGRADGFDLSLNSLDVSMNVIEGRADGLDVSVNVLEGRADGFDLSLNSLDVSMNVMEGRADGFDVSLNSLDVSMNIMEVRADGYDLSINILENRNDMKDISINILTSRVDNLDSSMNVVEGRADGFDVSLNSLDVSMNVMEGRADGFDVSLNSLDVSMNVMEGRADGFDASLNSLDVSMNVMEGRADGFDASLNSLDVSMNVMEGRADGFDASLNSLDVSMNVMEGRADGFDVSLNSLDISMNVMEGRADGFDVSLNSLDVSMNVMEGRADGFDVSLNSLDNLKYDKTGGLIDGSVQIDGVLNMSSQNIENVQSIHFVGDTVIENGDSFDISSNKKVTVRSSSDVVLHANTVVKQNLDILGNLHIKGTTTQVSTQDLVIKDNLIVINQTMDASGNVDLSGELIDPNGFESGFVVFRGTDPNSGDPTAVREPFKFLYSEDTKTFNVGVTGDMQPVATREFTPVMDGIAVWKEEENRFVTERGITVDPSGNMMVSGEVSIQSDLTMNDKVVKQVSNIEFSNSRNYLSDIETLDVSVNVLEGRADGLDVSVNVLEGRADGFDLSLNSLDVSMNIMENRADMKDMSVNILEGRADGFDASLNSLDVSMNVMEGRADGFDVSLNTLDVSMNVMENRADGFDASLNSLDISMNVMEGRADGFDASLNSLDISMNVMENRADGFDASLNSLDISMNVIEGRVDSLDVSVNVLEGRADGFDVSLNSLDVSMNVIEGRADGFDASLNSLDISMNVIESRADGLDVSVNVLEGRADGFDASLNSLDVSMNVLEGRADGFDVSLNSLDVSMNVMEGRADGFDASLNSLDVSMNVMEGRADGFDASLNSLDVSMNVMEGRADGFDASLNSLDVSMNVMEGRADGFDASLNSLDTLKFDKVGGLITGEVTMEGDLKMTDTDISGVNKITFSDGSFITIGNSLNLNGVLSVQKSDNGEEERSTTFNKSLVVKENLDILGNLNVKGSTTQISTQELVIKDNLIVINQTMDASGNIDLSGEHLDPTGFESGFVVYRGVNSGDDPTKVRTPYQFLYSEETNTFNVGISGEMQPVATREFAPSTDGVAVWNSTDFKFDTMRGVTVDTSGNMSIQGELSVHSDVTLNNRTLTDVSDITFVDGTAYIEARDIQDLSINILENRVDSVDASLNILEGRADGFDVSLNSLDVSMNVMEERADGFDVSLNSLDISVNILEGRADMKDISVNILENRADGFDASLNSLDVSMNVMEGRADGFDVSLNSLDVSVNILENRAGNFDASLNSLDVSMNVMEGRADGFDVSLNSLDTLKYDKTGGVISGEVILEGDLKMTDTDISGVNRITFSDGSFITIGNSLNLNGVLSIQKESEGVDQPTVFSRTSEFKQDVDIHGDLIVKGTSTQINTEELIIKDNLIVINQTIDASGNVDLSGELQDPRSFESGFVIYRGVDSTSEDPTTVRPPFKFLYSEDTNTLNVGISGETLPVATREFTPTTNGVAVWNSTEAKFDTVRGTTIDTSGNVDISGNLEFYSTDISSIAFLGAGSITDLSDNIYETFDISTNKVLQVKSSDFVLVDSNTIFTKCVDIIGTASNSSDQRIKRNEQEITNAVDVFMKMKPKVYEKLHMSMDGVIHEDQAVKESGLIAQEIYYDTPELRYLVKPAADAKDIEETPPSYKDGEKQDWSNWGSRPATVNYIGLIPHLIQAVKELNTKHQELQQKYDEQSDELNLLKKKLQ